MLEQTVTSKAHLICIFSLTALIAAPALASGPQLYGLIDIYGGVIKSGSHTTDSLDSGGLQSSRFGLRGEERLNADHSITYTLEAGFNSNDGTAAVEGGMFNRQSWIGYKNKNLGEFRIGNQNSAFFHMLSNTGAFYGGTFAAGLNTLSGYHFRSSNDISFISKSFNGLSGELHYSRIPKQNRSGNNYGTQVAVQYRKGPLYVMTGYVQQKLTTSTHEAVNRQYALGGSYDFSDKLTAYVGFFKNKQNDDSINKKLYSASLAWNFDSTSRLSVGYTRINLKADKANTDNKTLPKKSHADHYGIMYIKDISSRTTLYAAGAYIKNGSNVNYALGAAQPPNAQWLNRPKPGQSTKGIQVGFRHTF